MKKTKINIKNNRVMIKKYLNQQQKREVEQFPEEEEAYVEEKESVAVEGVMVVETSTASTTEIRSKK